MVMILHAPGGSGPEPAAAPAPPSPDPNCTAEPSPARPAAAHPLESGSLCSHPWLSPRNPVHLHKISMYFSLLKGIRQHFFKKKNVGVSRISLLEH